jgi:hypothetical protein
MEYIRLQQTTTPPNGDLDSLNSGPGDRPFLRQLQELDTSVPDFAATLTTTTAGTSNAGYPQDDETGLFLRGLASFAAATGPEIGAGDRSPRSLDDPLSLATAAVPTASTSYSSNGRSNVGSSSRTSQPSRYHTQGSWFAPAADARLGDGSRSISPENRSLRRSLLSNRQRLLNRFEDYQARRNSPYSDRVPTYRPGQQQNVYDWAPVAASNASLPESSMGAAGGGSDNEDDTTDFSRYLAFDHHDMLSHDDPALDYLTAMASQQRGNHLPTGSSSTSGGSGSGSMRHRLFMSRYTEGSAAGGPSSAGSSLLQSVRQPMRINYRGASGSGSTQRSTVHPAYMERERSAHDAATAWETLNRPPTRYNPLDVMATPTAQTESETAHPGRSRGERPSSSHSTTNTVIPSRWAEEAITYLERLRFSSSNQEALSAAHMGGFFCSEFFSENTPSFVLDTSKMGPVPKSSWLHVGCTFEGSQYTDHSEFYTEYKRVSAQAARLAETPSAAEISLAASSATTRMAMAASRAMNASTWSRRPERGERSTATGSPTAPSGSSSAAIPDIAKYIPEDHWKVKVTIHSVDYETSQLTGTMEAVNVPDRLSGTSSSIITYLEGEIVDFKNFSLETTKFDSTPERDAQYWKRLEPFKEMDDLTMSRALLNQKWLETVLRGKYILMRWKGMFSRCAELQAYAVQLIY